MKIGVIRFLTVLLLTASLTCWGQKRKIIIDQDAAGPAGTDQQSILLLIQSPQTEVLGITVVTGDQWLKAEVAHTLRMLELIGRTDIPVVPGAEYPLVRRKDETELWEQRYGSVAWVGAWTPRLYHPPDDLGDMPEGKPTTKPADEDAAHFLIRMVHKYPQRDHDLRGRPDDQPGAGHLHRSRICRAGERTGLHGRQPESADYRSRVHQHSPARIQSLVRSGSGSHYAAGAVEKDRLHPRGYFGEDENDRRIDQSDQSRATRRPHATSARTPACMANTTIYGMNWPLPRGSIPA